MCFLTFIQEVSLQKRCGVFVGKCFISTSILNRKFRITVIVIRPSRRSRGTVISLTLWPSTWPHSVGSDLWPVGAVHVSRSAAEPGAVWRHTSTTSSLVLRPVTGRHRDVTAASQRLWRSNDVSTWLLRQPKSPRSAAINSSVRDGSYQLTCRRK